MSTFACTLLVIAHAVLFAGTSTANAQVPVPKEFTFAAGGTAHLTLSNQGEESTASHNNRGTNFDTVSGFPQVSLTYRGKLKASVELYATKDKSGRPGTIELFGAWLEYKPSRALELRAGMIPLTVTGWPDRIASQVLVGEPLTAQYLLSLHAGSSPATNQELAEHRAGVRQQFVVSLPNDMGKGRLVTGAYAQCWDTGIETRVAVGETLLRFAVTEGTPGSPTKPFHWGDRTFRTLQGRVTHSFSDDLRIGASFANGPYLLKTFSSRLRAGQHVSDFTERLFGADLSFRFAERIEVNGEVAWNRFTTPFLSDTLTTYGWYAELEYIPLANIPDVKVAVRYSKLGFSEIQGPTIPGSSSTFPWDAPVDRVETGLQYLFDKDRASVKLDYQFTKVEGLSTNFLTTPERREHIVALQFTVRR